MREDNALLYKSDVDHIAIDLWRHFNKYTSPMSLDDLKQAGMIGVLKALQTKDSSVSTFRAYIKLRAKGEMIEELRRHRTSARHKYDRNTLVFYGHDGDLFMKQIEDDTILEEEVDREILIERVFAKIESTLSESNVRLINDHFFKERTLEELAGEFGIGSSALCRRLKVALRELKEAL